MTTPRQKWQIKCSQGTVTDFTDFDTLGIKFRVYFDLGVREQDYRGMVKFKGEA